MRSFVVLLHDWERDGAGDHYRLWSGRRWFGLGLT